MRHIKISFIFLFLFANISCKKNREARKADNSTITIDGIKRDYLWYEPNNLPSAKIPLLFCFHGGGGKAKSVYSLGFNSIAEREKFIVVYPDGFDKNWNDGRNATCIDQTKNDSKFIEELIAFFALKYNIDTSRVFATGMSNGAIFCNYLAYKLPGKFKAIAPVCGSIAEPISSSYTSTPTSAIIINGTDDDLVKYNGGYVTRKECRGKVISIDNTLKKWLTINSIASAPVISEIPDIDKKDDCKATRYDYTAGINNTKISFIKIEKGGHNWPGKDSQKLPFTGNKCNDFEATEIIWDFFRSL